MKISREWLKQKRLNKNLNHEDVAKAAGIHRAYYTMIESGYRDPSVDVAKRIAATLGFDWPIFFDNDGNVTQPSPSKEAV